jgi:hypothetical protein
MNRAGIHRVLADILEEQEKEGLPSGSGFNISTWFNQARLRLPAGQSKFTLKAGVSPTLCGTTMCVAGFAAIEAGWSVQIRKIKQTYSSQSWDAYETQWISPSTQEHRELDFWTVGAEYLGLERYQAFIIFYGTFDGGCQSVRILERLAVGDMPTVEEWKEYARIAGKLDSSMLYEECNAPWGRSEYDRPRCHCGCED